MEPTRVLFTPVNANQFKAFAPRVPKVTVEEEQRSRTRFSLLSVIASGRTVLTRQMRVCFNPRVGILSFDLIRALKKGYIYFSFIPGYPSDYQG